MFLSHENLPYWVISPEPWQRRKLAEAPVRWKRFEKIAFAALALSLPLPIAGAFVGSLIGLVPRNETSMVWLLCIILAIVLCFVTVAIVSIYAQSAYLNKLQRRNLALPIYGNVMQAFLDRLLFVDDRELPDELQLSILTKASFEQTDTISQFLNNEEIQQALGVCWTANSSKAREAWKRHFTKRLTPVINVLSSDIAQAREDMAADAELEQRHREVATDEELLEIARYVRDHPGLFR